MSLEVLYIKTVSIVFWVCALTHGPSVKDIGHQWSSVVITGHHWSSLGKLGDQRWISLRVLLLAGHD